MNFGFDWPSSFREKCSKIMVMYMYIAPGQGQTAPWSQFVFQKHKSSINLVICCKFYPLNDFVTVFPIQTYRQPNMTLAKNYK